MGCACFKQEIVVSKNTKSLKNNVIDEGNKKENININIIVERENNQRVANPRSSNNNIAIAANNNHNERVNQNRVIRNQIRGVENANNLMPNEPYLQSKQNPNFNMPEDGKSEFM
jgi:hypothetical protein